MSSITPSPVEKSPVEKSPVKTAPSTSLRCYLQEGTAQEALQGLPAGSVRLFSFSPPYLDNVDYERAGEKGDNRFGWDNLANERRIPDGHPGYSGDENTNSEETAGGEKGRDQGAGQQGSGGQQGAGDQAISEKTTEYINRHLRICREIERVGASTSVVCVEIDSVRENGAFRLIDLVGHWRRMLERIGYRIAEEITLGRKIAVSRRGAQLMREEEQYQRPGYFAPANVTSTVLVGFRGSVQERLRADSTAERDGFSKDWAKSYIKNLWHLDPPGADRMDREGHPCPQSLRVARALVRFYSVAGDMVCDPYAGAGTTGIAALQEGRHAALIEPVSAFCDEIRERVKATAGIEPTSFDRRDSVSVPGEQIRLPILRQSEKETVRQAVFPDGASPTERHREMAREVGRMIGREVPPSVMAAALRGERSYYDRA